MISGDSESGDRTHQETPQENTEERRVTFNADHQDNIVRTKLKEEMRENWKQNFQKYITTNINMREYNVNLKSTPEAKYIEFTNEIVKEEIPIIEQEYEIDMWMLNVIYHTTAVTVLRKKGRLKENIRTVKKKEKPGWQIRMESRIEAIRKKISHVYVLLECTNTNNYTKRQKTIKRRMENITAKSNLDQLLVELKQDLRVESEMLRRKKTIQERILHKQNV